jgi:hypothetical protein
VVTVMADSIRSALDATITATPSTKRSLSSQTDRRMISHRAGKRRSAVLVGKYGIPRSGHVKSRGFRKRDALPLSKTKDFQTCR